jgi:hypothetical protein
MKVFQTFTPKSLFNTHILRRAQGTHTRTHRNRRLLCNLAGECQRCRKNLLVLFHCAHHQSHLFHFQSEKEVKKKRKRSEKEAKKKRKRSEIDFNRYSFFCQRKKS